MAAVSGPQSLSDPDGEAVRFARQITADAAAEASSPSRYRWGSGYWCAIKTGRWPNVTGWAEQREAQRIYGPRLEQLLADGIPKDEARQQASDHAKAEMLTLTTARKEASDRLYARNRPTPMNPAMTDPASIEDVTNDD